MIGTERSAEKNADISTGIIRVEMNLSAERKSLPAFQNADAELVLCNYPHREVSRLFEPYEVRIWYFLYI
ncbi:MAG: hypothetical protein ACOX1A_03845 [Saccharofermentanales bacterium]